MEEEKIIEQPIEQAEVETVETEPAKKGKKEKKVKPKKEKLPPNPRAIVALVLSIICFAGVFLALGGAIVGDLVTFFNVFINFFGAIIVSFIIFFIGFVIMILSIFLIFGIYWVENAGFFPLEWASNAYKEIMQQAALTQEQVNTFIVIRIVLLVVCALIFILSFVNIILMAVANKKSKKKLVGSSVTVVLFSIFSMILSFLGIGVAIVMLLRSNIMTVAP